MSISPFPIILASESPARLELLKSINIIPQKIIPAYLDESVKKNELPKQLAARLAFEKANKIVSVADDGIVIAADTLVNIGRSVLPKAISIDDIKDCLKLLSQRRHRVYSGVCIIKKWNNQMIIRQRLVKTIIKFKKLTNDEIEFYSTLDEGLNKAGGYSIRGFAQSFVSFITGSFSNVVGLPLFETVNMLKSLDVNICINK